MDGQPQQIPPPSKTETNHSTVGQVAQPTPTVAEREEHLQMLFQKVVGDDGVKLTEKQVDEVLDQRAKITNYIHEERMQEHEEFKINSRNNIYYFFGSIIAGLALLSLILWKKPEYLGQVISAIFGFLGGLGLGKKTSKNSDNSDK